MKVFNRLSVAAVSILFCTGALFAQAQQQVPEPLTDITDEEIEQLVDAIHDIQEINSIVEEKMGDLIEEEELTFDRFRELMMAMQNPQLSDQVNMTDEEMGKLQNIQPKLMEIQGEAELEIIAKIEEHGFTLERYQGIIATAQQDPDLLAKIQEKLEIE